MGTINSIVSPGRQMALTFNEIDSPLSTLPLDDNGNIIPGVYLGPNDTPELDKFLQGSMLKQLFFDHYLQEDEDGDEVLCLDITRDNKTYNIEAYYQNHRIDLTYQLKRGSTNILILIPHSHKYALQDVNQVKLKGYMVPQS